MKYDFIIGIDPDVDRNGIAVLQPKSRKLETGTKSFFELYDYLKAFKAQAEERGATVIVVVEAGWLIKTNWHLNSREGIRTASAKGNSAGRNHETGRKIVEMCDYLGMVHAEVKPYQKCWAGPDRKITHEELASFTGLSGHTNQEARDAALIAWLYGNLPITINPAKLTEIYQKRAKIAQIRAKK